MVSVHASPLAHNGGVDVGEQSVHVSDLSAALARRGHEVVVHARRDDPHLPDCVAMKQGYTVVHVPAGPARVLPIDALLPHMMEFARFLAARWTHDRPDVVHAHFWMSGLAVQQAAKRCGVPTVQTFHTLGTVNRRHQGADDTSPDGRIKLETLLARCADWVAATSIDEVSELVRMGRPRARTSVVPCGVDVHRFRPDGSVAPRSTRQRIVSVGRLVPRKGFETMIRALPEIPRAELVIVGGPPRGELGADAEAQRLRRLAARLGVAERVCLTGGIGRDDLPAVLRSADVVSCTPWYEPFGIVPLEAMACGIPVVAAAVGGIRGTVVDEVTGRLVPPNSPHELAEAINPLLRNPQLRAELGRAGCDRARRRYTWDRIAADTERIYERLVLRRGLAPLDSRSG
jgi:glycosyltransferase involved in cell wall biosynthesis